MNDDSTKAAIASLLIVLGLAIAIPATAKLFIQARPHIQLEIKLDIK